MAAITERHKISDFLVFYLVHGSIFGVGVLSFQRVVVEVTGNDAWIAVILSGLFVHLIVWMMYYILKDSNGSLMTLHQDIFGKWIGNAFNLVWIGYFFTTALVILRTYIEVIEVWMFPDITVWFYSAIFILLVFYIIMGGIRVVTGIAFFGVILPLYLLFTFIIYPLEFADYNNLLPVLSHSPLHVLSGVNKMTFTFIGFESLLIYYPFIKNAEKSRKWAQIAILFSTILYVIIMMISIVYFTEEELLRNTWPTLTMWKIVEMPFVERFEYIGIANWSFIILPNICIALWCVNRGLKEMFGIQHQKVLIFILVLMFVFTNMMTGRNDLEEVNEMLNIAGYYLIFYYIPLLFIVTFIRKAWKKRRGQNA